MSEWQEEAWNTLPIEMRRTAVIHLREEYSVAFFEEVWVAVTEYGLGEWMPAGWHGTQGMTVRNVLRDVIGDLELPEPHNWDDFYVPVVEAAAGCRSVD